MISNKEYEQKLRSDAIAKAIEHYKYFHKNKDISESRINYAGRVFDEEEISYLINASLDFWLTAGKYSDEFEFKFSEFLNVQYCSLTNSGSSANLLAFMALTSNKLEERRIKRGDEVITIAAGFPTTITPIIQYGAVPVFIDVNIPSYNINCDMLEKALSKTTKAVMIAHTLGNPFDIEKVKNFCDKYNLWLIEDNCDALGSKYLYKNKWYYTGTIGDIGTSSFYPPHHITMGEGGAVYTNNLQLKRIIESMRDWGRDCYCKSGKDNTCDSRFTRKYSKLPFGYDHKYVYSNFGYNLNVTDLQAAIGCAQLGKLNKFICARRKNWEIINDGLSCLDDFLILPEPIKNSIPSWFGFVITLKDNIIYKRYDLTNFLENSNIQTRALFAGNITLHPCFDEMRKEGKGYRIIGNLRNTNKILNDTFWIGVYPGLTVEKIEYMINKMKEFFNK
jgi:CDP-6-deoxy-D-xylo-4-hexulose-3-dehydrase